MFPIQRLLWRQEPSVRRQNRWSGKQCFLHHSRQICWSLSGCGNSKGYEISHSWLPFFCFINTFMNFWFSGWTRWPPEVPSNLNYPVILTYTWRAWLETWRCGSLPADPVTWQILANCVDQCLQTFPLRGPYMLTLVLLWCWATAFQGEVSSSMDSLCH